MCAGEIGIVVQGWIDGCLALANSVRVRVRVGVWWPRRVRWWLRVGKYLIYDFKILLMVNQITL